MLEDVALWNSGLNPAAMYSSSCVKYLKKIINLFIKESLKHSRDLFFWLSMVVETILNPENNVQEWNYLLELHFTQEIIP